jgi:hypothetical protein
MKKVARRRPPAKKKKKNSNIQSWCVVTKGDYINAAIDNHNGTVEKLEAMGYKVVGNPAFVDKDDAIEYIKFYLLQTTGKKYKKEPKRK